MCHLPCCTLYCSNILALRSPTSRQPCAAMNRAFGVEESILCAHMMFIHRLCVLIKHMYIFDIYTVYIYIYEYTCACMHVYYIYM